MAIVWNMWNLSTVRRRILSHPEGGSVASQLLNYRERSGNINQARRELQLKLHFEIVTRNVGLIIVDIFYETASDLRNLLAGGGSVHQFGTAAAFRALDQFDTATKARPTARAWALKRFAARALSKPADWRLLPGLLSRTCGASFRA